jgi:hypothetical protein
MSMLLTPLDFPLMNVGPLVYRQTQSSPMFQAMDDQMAADLVCRLNREEMVKWYVSSHVERPASRCLVYGP